MMVPYDSRVMSLLWRFFVGYARDSAGVRLAFRLERNFDEEGRRRVSCNV